VPIARIPIGRFVFAPSWSMTALTLALCVVFIGLGRWQWERGEQREAQWDEFQQGAQRAVPLVSRGTEELPRFQRVEVSGRFDVSRQFLLENRTYQGRAGYEVLTPLVVADGRTLLVNRGWIPFTGFRDRLPDVSFEPPASITVKGLLDELPVAGLARGRVAPSAQGSWPRVASFPTAKQLGEALGRDIEPRLLLLDAREPFGYTRKWRPPGLEPARHWSYAIQWWSFAAVLIVLWAVLSTRKVS
jgi:surfeit locus 1 family protein